MRKSCRVKAVAVLASCALTLGMMPAVSVAAFANDEAVPVVDEVAIDEAAGTDAAAPAENDTAVDEAAAEGEATQQARRLAPQSYTALENESYSITATITDSPADAGLITDVTVNGESVSLDSPSAPAGSDIAVYVAVNGSYRPSPSGVSGIIITPSPDGTVYALEFTMPAEPVNLSIRLLPPVPVYRPVPVKFDACGGTPSDSVKDLFNPDEPTMVTNGSTIFDLLSRFTGGSQYLSADAVERVVAPPEGTHLDGFLVNGDFYSVGSDISGVKANDATTVSFMWADSSESCIVRFDPNGGTPQSSFGSGEYTFASGNIPLSELFGEDYFFTLFPTWVKAPSGCKYIGLEIGGTRYYDPKDIPDTLLSRDIVVKFLWSEPDTSDDSTAPAASQDNPTTPASPDPGIYRTAGTAARTSGTAAASASQAEPAAVEKAIADDPTPQAAPEQKGVLGGVERAILWIVLAAIVAGFIFFLIKRRKKDDDEQAAA